MEHPSRSSSSSSASECSAQCPSLQAQEPTLQFCRRQVFQRKLRNQGCSFTRDWLSAVASHCLPHPTLSLASEQTLKYPRGINVEMRRWGEGIWLARPPKVITGVKYQFHQDFWPDQRSRNPNHSSPPLSRYLSNIIKLFKRIFCLLNRIYGRHGEEQPLGNETRRRKIYCSHPNMENEYERSPVML